MSNVKDQVESVIESLEAHHEGLYRCDCCHEHFDDEEEAQECCDSGAEYQSLYDYFEDVLDINYILDSQRNLKGVRLLVCFGGPNVWVDTVTCTVEGHWWDDSYEERFSSQLAAEIDSVFEELFNC